MRIAFFGGSFDPPHLGHLRIARTALERLNLDEVLLAPVGRQPLKREEPASFADRLAMVEMLVQRAEGLKASAMDAPLGDSPNYTTETLARLRSGLRPGAELFFLAGADSFLTLREWRRPEALLEPAGGLLDGWILAARPGFALDSLAAALPLGFRLGENSELPGPVLTQAVVGPGGEAATPLWLLPDMDDASTATRVREALARGENPPHLTDGVRGYIRERSLYEGRERMLG